MFFFSPMCLCIHITVYAGDLLKCKCSRPLCDQSYCHTNFKCYKSISVHSNEEEEVMFGCYEKGGPADRFNACNNGTLDTPTHKIRCCNDNDMCNEDLDVTLGGPESSSPTTPPVTQSPSPTGMLYLYPYSHFCSIYTHEVCHEIYVCACLYIVYHHCASAHMFL